MKPSLSYVLWFTQRNGSTLLCKGLESTGIAGKPGEWINCGGVDGIFEKYHTRDPEELQAAIWREGSTPNKVFGLKYGFYQPHHDQIIDLLRHFPGCSPDASAWEAWENAFPNCKHIFLTRRNKVRQAVSWWKAIQSGQWHREKGARPASQLQDDAYDFDAINHLFSEAVMREAGIQEFLALGKITPLTIFYEDMVLDFEGAVCSIVDYLNVAGSSSYSVGDFFYEKLANELSEVWVQRFREELQADWTNKGW